MAVEVRPAQAAAELAAFLSFPWRVYHGDPCWVPPLVEEVAARLDPARNPFYQLAERELFLAWRGEEIVGRVAAIDNRAHNEQLGESVGFFGFFESVDDPEVAGGLLDVAGAWVGARGRSILRGPVNGALTDEAGVLVAGHDRRPAMWEAHSPRYYRPLLEHAGWRKFDDLLAYELDLTRFGPDVTELPRAVRRVHRRASARSDVSIRGVRMAIWDAELATALGLYNTAFRTIPGHGDMSAAQFRRLAQTVRPFVDPALLLVAEVDGQAVGFLVALPEINEALRHLNGRLTRWGLLKLWWYRRRIRTLCVKLLGVLPEHRGRGIETLLGVELVRRALHRGYRRAELSLISERNVVMNQLLARAGATVYRTHRLYERDL